MFDRDLNTSLAGAIIYTEHLHVASRITSSGNYLLPYYSSEWIIKDLFLWRKDISFSKYSDFLRFWWIHKLQDLWNRNGHYDTLEVTFSIFPSQSYVAKFHEQIWLSFMTMTMWFIVSLVVEPRLFPATLLCFKNTTQIF